MFFTKLFSVFTVLALSKWNKSLAEPSCFDSSKENLNIHLGTKTPYRFIFNRNDRAVTYPGNRVTFSVLFRFFFFEHSAI